MILGGERIDAQRAHRWGLVHRLAEDCRAEARSWAESIMGSDAEALRHAKRIIDLADLDTSLAREREAQALLYARRSR